MGLLLYVDIQDISIYYSMVQSCKNYICLSTPTSYARPHIWISTRVVLCTYICARMAACPIYYMRYINVLSMWYVSTPTGVSTTYRSTTAGIISTVVIIIVLLVLPIYPIHHIVLSGHLGRIAFGDRFVLVSL